MSHLINKTFPDEVDRRNLHLIKESYPGIGKAHSVFRIKHFGDAFVIPDGLVDLVPVISLITMPQCKTMFRGSVITTYSGEVHRRTYIICMQESEDMLARLCIDTVGTVQFFSTKLPCISPSDRPMDIRFAKEYNL